VNANRDIAAKLDEIASMLELAGENPFKVSAHARAARAIGELSTDVADLATDIDKLRAVAGVGQKIAAKIVEYLETGDIKAHRDLRSRIPAGLLDVLKVPGLGPKTVKILWENMGVESVADLEQALDDPAIFELPRMGKKSVEKIRASLQFAKTAGDRTPIGVALPIAERIAERLQMVAGVRKAQFAGSLRRGRETIGDIDMLVAADEPAVVSQAFQTMPEVVDVIAAGETKSSVRTRFKRKGESDVTMQVDLRVIKPDCFGAALLYFTGSKDHNVLLREFALAKGYSLNEYGLYPLTQGEKGKQGARPREASPIASRTEEEIYTALGLRWIPPELREGHSELEPAGKLAIKLVERKQIRAELHAHTTASDGAMAIDELARQATARGFHTIAVTDHSKGQPIAGGLSVERLLDHIERVRETNARVKGIQILAGSEVDILADGSLDYDDKALAQLDIVVASPHAALTQTAEKATKRLLRAVANPHVDILGHPTGRLIGKREGLSPDISAVAAKAAQMGVAMEINAHWMRLDLRDIHVRAALDMDAFIAINCDVHREVDFDNLRFGVLTARRGGLTSKRCVNTWSANRLRQWLHRHGDAKGHRLA